MSIIYLTRRIQFCAAHRLHNPALSEEENIEIFGKCNNFNGHGHNYTLAVTLRGKADPKTGMLINLTDLDDILRKHIHDKCDHYHFNKDIPEFDGIIPTIENILIVFWNILSEHLAPGMLYEIMLHENDNNYGIYRGETS